MKQTLLIGIFIISTLNTFSQNNELLGTFKFVFIGETIENTKHKAVFSGITHKAEHLAKAIQLILNVWIIPRTRFISKINPTRFQKRFSQMRMR